MSAGSKATTRKSSRLWFAIHSWLGMKLCLFMLFVLVTGTVATVSHEIEWLFAERVRADTHGTASSWGAQLESARRAYPHYTIGYAQAGIGPRFATVFSATSSEGETRKIFVDPYKAAVKGSSGFVTFPAFMRQLHYQLITSTSLALYAVCALAFLLAGSLVSGLVVYKKFWRGFFRLRIGQGARVFWGDLHRLLGLWSIWFVLVMIVTSIWYFVERGMYDAGYSVERAAPRIDPRELAAYSPERPQMIGVDRAVEIARSAMPDLVVRTVSIPHSPRQPYVVAGQAAAWLVRDRANHVAVHPVSGAVLEIRRAEEMQLAERWAHTADPLHFGNFAGLGVKLVWVVFGMAMSAMVASGMVLWAKRSVKATRALYDGIRAARAMP